VTQGDENIAIRDNPACGRYELLLDGTLAGLAAYVIDDGVMTIPHTEVRPQYEGRGLGGRLAKSVLDDARRRGLGVVPRCPFVAAYIKRHPEYDDLVVPDT
jgi:predicted GNAT family acetyltransferase